MFSIMKFYKHLMIIANISGFFDSKTIPEICTRWHYIEAFQPLFRKNIALTSSISRGDQRFNQRRKTQLSLMEFMKMKTAIQRIITSSNTITNKWLKQFSLISHRTKFTNLFLSAFPETKALTSKFSNQTEIEFYFLVGIWFSIFEPVGECIESKIEQLFTTYDLQQNPVDLYLL